MNAQAHQVEVGNDIIANFTNPNYTIKVVTVIAKQEQENGVIYLISFEDLGSVQVGKAISNPDSSFELTITNSIYAKASGFKREYTIQEAAERLGFQF